MIASNSSGVLQQGAGGDGGVELLPVCGRRAAELAGGNLGVLRLQRGHHVAGGQVVVVELGRIQPDAHGVLGAEDLHLADALEAADDVLDVGYQIVGQRIAVHRAVLRNQADNQQEVAGRFDHLIPCRCTICGSSGMASCSLFCICTWAMLGSVPALKVRVIAAAPDESLLDDM